ncbi:MAG: pseudouridine synthase [Tissierellia bacterium]|nr:pseudouridine synthase [Tissierellia bacterium]
MRLNKYIARAGISSRRKADELVFNGRVRVNGNTVDHPGIDIGKEDVVEVDGDVIKLEGKLVYYLLHKPLDYVTTVDDPHEKLQVVDLIDTKERIYPAGRLDKDSTGLLLLTNDGILTHRITHPRYGIKKTYDVLVSGHPSKKNISRLEKGIIIDDYLLNPCTIEGKATGKDTSSYFVTIDEGRNRQIRKMFHRIGHPVIELCRIQLGPLHLGNLAPGEYRELKKNELKELKEECYR